MGEATIVVGSDGSYVDASPAALQMLGLTLQQLRAMAPGSLSSREMGAEERRAMLGVRILLDEQPDGGVVARLGRAMGAVDEAPFYSVGDVLSAWRAAERRLEELEPGTPEWDAADAEIEQLRAEYRCLSERRGRTAH